MRHIPLINKEYHQNTSALQKLSQRINALLFAFLGGWAGYCGYDVYLYLQDPDVYLSQSAPWYTNIVLYSGVTAGVVVLCLVAKFAIKHLDQKEKP